MSKEKLRKVGLCYFIKPFKMTINHKNFNRLVMKVTQIIFLLTKYAYMALN